MLIQTYNCMYASREVGAMIKNVHANSSFQHVKLKLFTRFTNK